MSKEHKLSLSEATLLTINIFIGSGILIGPGLIAAVAGNASFLAWPMVALLYLPMVLCMVQLGRIFPQGGGFYAYTHESFGKLAGYVSIMLYVIGYTFAVAMEVLAFRATLVANIGENAFVCNTILFNAVTILICMWLNSLSIKIFSRILNFLTITKILPLVALIALLPFILHWDFSVTAVELSALPGALPLAMFGFLGFEYCSSLAPMIKDNATNGPRATMLAFMITAVIYTLFHFGLLNLMGAQELGCLGASGGSVYAQFLSVPIPFLKEFLLFLIPIASVLAIFATGNGLLNSNVVNMHVAAEQKLFMGWSWIKKMNTNGRPWVALIIQGIVIMAVSTPELFGAAPANIDTIATNCVLAVFLSFILPLKSLFFIQMKRGQHYQLPLTGLAIVVAFGLSIYSITLLGATYADRISNALPLGIVIVMCGLLFALRKD